MKKRVIIRTNLFEQQLDEQLEWYVMNSDNPRVPIRFLDAVEKSVTEIAETPEIFSRLIPRKGYEYIERLGLRFKRIDKHFPFYIYYMFDDHTVTLRFIWRGGRDRERLISESSEKDFLEDQ